jgi:predicted RNase H-like HicB family nuclease
MAKRVSIIVREDDPSWWAWSPQCPGLMAGDETEADLLRSLPETIDFYFEDDDVDDFDIQFHVERPMGDGVFVRVARDERQAARQEVADRIAAALAVPASAERLRKAPSDQFGEVTYVCALPTDTRAWLECQLDDKHGPVNVVVPVSDTTLWTWAVRARPIDAAANADEAPPSATFGEAAQTKDRRRIFVPA